MGFFDKFNHIGKDMPKTSDLMKIPSHVKETAINVNLNKIAIRYFLDEFAECIETSGEIHRMGSTSIVLFNVPEVKGAVLLINKFTYINRSRNNERTMDVYENYPFGVDKNCDVLKFEDVDYQNFRDNRKNETVGASKAEYYKKYKWYIPVMMNQIPLPIVRLDDADRLIPIDKTYTKLLANVTQVFLREFMDIKLLQRTGNKAQTGMIYVAILFLVIGAFGGLVISSFL
jgi:hypothetical protein